MRLIPGAAVAVALMSLLLAPCGGGVAATMAPAPAPTTTNVATDGDFLLYLPTNAAARGPLQVLVAVHGMNGNGVAFAAPLRSTAERNGWILVAPTFHYRDNINPAGVLQDDTTLL